MRCTSYHQHGFCSKGAQCPYDHSPNPIQVNEYEFFTLWQLNESQWESTQIEKGLTPNEFKVSSLLVESNAPNPPQSKNTQLPNQDEEEAAVKRIRAKLLEAQQQQKQQQQKQQQQQLDIPVDVPQEEEEFENDQERAIVVKWQNKKNINFENPQIPHAHPIAILPRAVVRSLRQTVLERFLFLFARKYDSQKQIVAHAFEEEEKLYLKYYESRDVYWGKSQKIMKQMDGFQLLLDKEKNDNLKTQSSKPGGEKLYCYCRKPEDGRPMIACDYPECQIEWFHLDCVGLTEPPKGKWYCPDHRAI